ncbi:RNA-binding protein 8A [Kwoniella mangroviensis CBS 10435]|uniref:RNA-binding protein 8A n=2 Tax=Kwoniella TaxID=490731 RepID=A0A1B9IM69_9TREE|nr:RNA-binding protein 8A [Kwoniella mangroviensis CBS 8507]OCF56597.1 RNA-binding protein 8A [Kwoniella mangroviensis CBS 10435]OCF65331.1 RNA-binding protein 8A [Kwoniella mangroviensis CBS 8507]OCF75168.1 RNA-binding protein 8A [Kwoniella mangroviensis CBS 8886]
MADVDMAGEVNGAGHSWAAKSVEGWIIIVTGLNEETTEEDLQDLFGDYGEVKNLSMALNRRTGYVMGYALIEFPEKEQAEKAVKGTDGTTFLEKTIKTDFAFSKAPSGARSRAPASGARRTGRDREASPGRR